MAKGYVIGRAVVTNATQWAVYTAASAEAIRTFGGKPLVRGGRVAIAEGEGRARNIVLEFESFEAAQAFAFSEQYGAARKLREGAGSIDIVVVEGA